MSVLLADIGQIHFSWRQRLAESFLAMASA